MSLQPEFPAPIRFGGRLRFDLHEHENYKRALAGLPVVERGEAEPIRFVDASAVCADLAIDRRTLGRRVKGRVRGEACEPVIVTTDAEAGDSAQAHETGSAPRIPSSRRTLKTGQTQAFKSYDRS